MEMQTINSLILDWEKKLCGMGAVDNQRCMGLWLRMEPDGSGSVMAEWSKVKHGDDKTRAMVRTVMTMEPHAILDFDTLDELHGGLVAQQMRVKRMGEHEEDRGQPGEEYWE